MFGGSRRHKAPQKPLTRETANPNAATAAASAFMRRDQPPSLSSAAAATALRSRPTTPTNVAEVQSKRVVRRSASLSSNVSRGRRPDLRRTPSNGSMSERTFRSPSPASGRSPLPGRHDVPPVPSLPKNEETRGRGQQPDVNHRRATSLQTQPLRTASQKMQDGRGSWYGAARTGNLTNIRTADNPAAVTHSSYFPDDRSGSISPSINFSYPRGLMESPLGNRPGSPMADQTLVYDANSRRMVPQRELLTKQYSLEQRQAEVQAAADRAVRKKKQDVNRSGSHLSKGTVGRTQAPALQETTRHATVSPEPARPSRPVSSPSADVPIPSVERPEAPRRASIEPSQVAVDELELPASAAKVTIPEPRTESAAVSHEENEPAAAKPRTSTQPTAMAPHSATLALKQSARTRDTQSVSPTPHEQRRPESIRRQRVHSESPARTARFGANPEHLVVKHEPPPRALSPRKSALKSSRGVSPSDDGSEMSSREESLPRKKAVRVSFNDQDTVVGEAAGTGSSPVSPVASSPQVKKPWHNLIGRKKKDDVAVEEDEKMTPRAALPVFGSVRAKKPAEQEERPLIRPSDRTYPSSDRSEASSNVGQSHDHAVGAVFAQDEASREHDPHEPLPPIVTSVDHDGYISNSSVYSDDEDGTQTQQSTAPTTQQNVEEDFTPETTQELDHPSAQTNGHHGVADKPVVEEQHTDVKEIVAEPVTVSEPPSIAVSHPTPIAEEDEEEEGAAPKKEYFVLPGEFPADDTPETSPTQATFHDSYETVPSPPAAAKNAKRPDPITPVKTHEVEPSQPSPSMDKIQEEQEETSDDSAVFSDAYEDLSDMDGEGFLSLDAIVSTPLKTKVLNKASEQAALNKSKGCTATVPASSEPAEHKTADDWEQAKAYWKSLTIDKRRQLEVEAMEEAGEEADREAAQKPKKNKKRRSMDNAGAVVQAARHPDRTYQIQPGTKWAEQESPRPKSSGGENNKLRKSMRGGAATQSTAQPAQAGSMKKSLRGKDDAAVNSESELGGRSSLRKSMRGQQNGEAVRPASYHPQSAVELAKLQYNTQQNQKSSAAAAATQPGLRRRGSNDSDSSFRRARSQSNPSAGFGFRNSMRGAPQSQAHAAPPVPEPNRSSRFSIRSLSPSPFRRSMPASPPPTTMGSGRMKSSLRASGNSSDGSSRVGMFGRSSSKKPSKRAGPRANGASRFGDSSDEDTAGRPAFRSRFADSSDEDEPIPRPKSSGGFASRSMRKSKPAPAVPSIPKGPIRSTSPDLPDSDDEPTQAPPGPAMQAGTLRRSRSGRGELTTSTSTTNALDSSTIRPQQNRRGSFMSILRRKKDTNGKISRDVTESAARRDTRLERSTEQLTLMRSNSGNRLQKANWPFPDGGGAAGDEDSNATSEVARPATSAGPAGTQSAPERPGVLRRRTVSNQVVPTEASGAKKKKFGALRKMFGIQG